MEKTTRARSESNLWILEDVQVFSDVIFNSRSAQHAVDLLAKHLEAASVKLLFAGVYDVRALDNSAVLYSDFPEALTRLCARFDEKKGCPLVQIALKGRKPFESLGLYLGGFDDFFSMKYLHELKNLNHENIGVIPVFFGRQAMIFFAGFEDNEKKEQILNLLNLVFTQVVCGLSVKFRIENLTGKVGGETASTGAIEKFDQVSRRQVECLYWLSQGKSVSDISEMIGLSEHTVNQCIENTCKVLKVKSTSHAIALAVQSGILDCRL